MGERTPLALIDAPASGRMAVAEAITNIAAADIARALATSSCRRTGWRRPVIRARTPRCTTRCARSRSTPASRSASSIPVGKDSMSMRTTWSEGGVERAVTAPVSLIVSAFAPVPTCAATLTPLLRLDAATPCSCCSTSANGRRRLGGSALAQVYGQLGDEAPDLDDPARARGVLRARCSGCAAARCSRITTSPTAACSSTLLEMAFASRCGLDVDARRRRRRSAAGAVRRGAGRGRAGARAATRRALVRDARDAGHRGARSSASRRAATACASRGAATACCSTSRASTCIARGRRPRTRCSGCATTPTAPTQEYARIARRRRSRACRRV